MEPFIDFGLFEILAASGIAWFARKIYTRRVTGVAFLAISVIAPAVLIFFSGEGWTRWLAAFCLMAAAVNAAVLLPVALQRRDA